MALGDRLPQRLRLSIKRRGAGVAERDVYPARYLANTPEALERVVRSAGFEPVSVEYVGTLHRYGARVPAAATILRAIEAALPDARRSTIVAAYSAPVRIV